MEQRLIDALDEIERLRADAGRCSATNSSGLFGTLRCEQPAGHDGDHLVQRDDVYSRWINPHMVAGDRLAAATARAEREVREITQDRDDWREKACELRARIAELGEEYGLRAHGFELVRAFAPIDGRSSRVRAVVNGGPAFQLMRREVTDWREVDDAAATDAGDSGQGGGE